MVENGVPQCDFCKRALNPPEKRFQIKIEPHDKQIFQDTLTALQAFGSEFKRQADGSVTLDACAECHNLFTVPPEQLKAESSRNFGLLQGSAFQLRTYVRKEDLDVCCGCEAAFPAEYEGYVTTVGPDRWFCRDCFEEFREALGLTLET